MDERTARDIKIQRNTEARTLLLIASNTLATMRNNCGGLLSAESRNKLSEVSMALEEVHADLLGIGEYGES